MNKMLVLALDQGTTGTTTTVMDEDGRIRARGYCEVRLRYPREAWVEQDPGELWESVERSVTMALQSGDISPASISAIGITNQRETSIVWDRASGKTLAPAIVWQCRRSAAICQELKERGLEPLFSARTGLVLDPYFSGTKLCWLKRNNPVVAEAFRAGTAAFGTVDSFLIHRLSGHRVHATDISNASRTLLFDIHKLAWDQELLELLELPPSCLPQLALNAGLIARTSGVGFLPDGIPIAGVAGDQQAALFGQTCFLAGESKCTFGTGAFMLVNTGSSAVRSDSGLLSTCAWQLGGETTYALEGSAFVAGAAVQWLRDGLGIIRRSAEVEALAASVPDSGGLCFVPALTGLGAPHWAPGARGLIWGLTRGCTAAHLARAVLEGIALQNRDILLAMQKDLGKNLSILRVDGGASANNLLMQIQADYLGIEVERPEEIESTSIGAAYLAGLGTGIWNSTSELSGLRMIQRVFRPCIDHAILRDKLELWSRCLGKAT